MGQCSSGPTVYVTPDRTWYCRVKPEDAIEIVTQHVQLNQPVERLLHPRFHPRCDS
jgi:(2Fe-2S) ferredoxin